MKIQFSFAMLFVILAGLLVNCNAATQYDPESPISSYHNELSFGFEFTLDNIISSATLANGSTYGLSKVAGGPAYQSLMRHYLDVAHHAYLTQQPPPGYNRQKLLKAILEEDERRKKFMRDPDSWWDYFAVVYLQQPEFTPEVFEGDEYTGDVEVDILARAVEVSTVETFSQLHRQFNISSDAFQWPYASVVTPDFLWTTIKPKPDSDMQPDGRVSWDMNFDHDSTWFIEIFRKFNTALYRNKIRRVEGPEWREILSSSTKMVFRTFPTSAERLLYVRGRHCMHPKEGPPLSEAECERHLSSPERHVLSPSRIVVDFNNATLSLWLEQLEPDWNSFNTFAELGAHVLKEHAGDAIAISKHWDQVIEALDTLTTGTKDAVDVVDLILSGDAWTAEHETLFENRLKCKHTRTGKNSTVKSIFHQNDVFVPSKLSAEYCNRVVNAANVCFFGAEPRNVVHDEA